MLSLTTQIFVMALFSFAALHVILLRTYLYWRHEWLDIPMHLFGGALIVFSVFVLRDLRVPFAAAFTRPAALLGIVLLIALSWEVFEYAAGVSLMRENFWSDTSLDLVLGLAGGMVGILVAHRLRTL